MPIRLSGINSGLDTDAIVKELVSAYSLKTEKYEKQKTSLEWKQDAWKSLNTKIYGFYTNVSSMRMSGTYSLKKTMVSDNTKATVTASSDAVVGTQKLNILQTAQASYLTGGYIGENVTNKSTLKDLGYTGGETTIKIKKEGMKEGEEIAIKINADTKISDITDKLADAGLNANLDTANGRIFLSAKESGKAGNFDLIAEDNNAQQALLALGLSDAEAIKAHHQTTVDAYEALVAHRDARAAHKEIYAALAKTGLTDTATADGGRAGLLSSDVRDMVSALYADGNISVDEIKDYLSNTNLGGDLPEGMNVDTAAAEIAAALANQTDNMKLVSDYVNAGNKDLISVSLDELNKQIKDGEKTYNEALEKIKNADVNSATKIKGQDAIIKLNNVEFTSSSNTFTINGLTIEANSVTGDGDDNAITISTSTDTQAIYDKIKDFLTEYNNLINEITKMYNAESAKDYEPLTDEEKEAMSDDQIEKWEGKIKSALLRRDNNLGNVMNAMINSMAQTYEVDGKKLSLSSFGISTLGFLNAAENEQNAFHIDGDEDDENTSGKKDKLMAAIQEDPDQVMDFMKQLASNLYSSIDEKMKSTELSSAYKVYNDKELDKEMTEIEKMIAKWEEKIADQEDAYFKKFSQMEVALSKLQSQTNSLGGLLGQ